MKGVKYLFRMMKRVEARHIFSFTQTERVNLNEHWGGNSVYFQNTK